MKKSNAENCGDGGTFQCAAALSAFASAVDSAAAEVCAAPLIQEQSLVLPLLSHQAS